jgi:hypothetical protein
MNGENHGDRRRFSSRKGAPPQSKLFATTYGCSVSANLLTVAGDGNMIFSITRLAANPNKANSEGAKWISV